MKPSDPDYCELLHDACMNCQAIGHVVVDCESLDDDMKRLMKIFSRLSEVQIRGLMAGSWQVCPRWMIGRSDNKSRSTGRNYPSRGYASRGFSRAYNRKRYPDYTFKYGRGRGRGK
ncbi:MAG: hypothetical protein GY907_09935 [Bacteroidetes bacterium]|nr:hypothetical protein [Bacteroidota bacterium]